MIIILYDDGPYEGAYTGCLEVPGDFDLSAEIRTYLESLEPPAEAPSHYSFLRRLQDKYPVPKMGVMEIGLSMSGLRITEPNVDYDTYHSTRPKKLNEF